MITVIKIFNWGIGVDEGEIASLHYNSFLKELSSGEDIPIELLQRWELP